MYTALPTGGAAPSPAPEEGDGAAGTADEAEPGAELGTEPGAGTGAGTGAGAGAPGRENGTDGLGALAASVAFRTGCIALVTSWR